MLKNASNKEIYIIQKEILYIFMYIYVYLFMYIYFLYFANTFYS